MPNYLQKIKKVQQGRLVKVTQIGRQSETRFDTITHLERLGEVIGRAQAYEEEEADLKEASAWW